MSRPRFLFAGLGTSGDILPLLALAAELRARGHDAALLANASFEARAAAAGVRFAAVAPRQINNATGIIEDLTTHVFPSYAPTFAFFAAEMADPRPTVVVNLDNINPSNAMCELFGLSLCRLHLAPHHVRSAASPPWPDRRQAEGLLGQTYRRHGLPAEHRQRETAPFTLVNINKFRTAWGLPPIAWTRAPERLVRQHVGLFPRWYGPPAADWPEGIALTGFPLPPPGAAGGAGGACAVPDALTTFIARRGRPLVFTPGTGTVDVQDFFRQAARCCEELGMPGVFLSPHVAAGDAIGTDGGFGPGIICFDHVELEPVLAEARLLVHHGGIGTTARALEAGLPQIISPLWYDQPDNGHRIASLGAGQVVERKGLTGEALAAAARALLASAETAAVLRDLGARVRADRAIAATADLLERQLDRPSRPSGAAPSPALEPTPWAERRPAAAAAARARAAAEPPAFVFAGTGTAGDILPLVAVAGEMRRRGYACAVLGNEPFAAQAAAHGLTFAAIAPRQANDITGMVHNHATYLFPSYAPTFAFFDELFSGRGRRPGAPPVIVNLDNFSATNLVAEARGLPVCRLYTAPFRIESTVAPPQPFKRQADGLLGRTFRRHTLPAIYRAWNEKPFTLTNINKHRRALGLPAIASARDVERLVVQHVGLFPAWYAVPAADWPLGIELPGFLLPPSAGSLPPELGDFISRDGPPLVFTTGTGVPRPEELFRHARLCCAAMGRPGVLLGARAGVGGAWGPEHEPRIMALDYVELDLLLARAALLVHHGGLGTTARALEAGVPQIVSPLAYDQPDNGARVAALGVGRVLPRAALSGAALAELASNLLDSAAVATRLAEVRRLVAAGADAVRRCGDILERRFGLRPDRGAGAPPRTMTEEVIHDQRPR